MWQYYDVATKGAKGTNTKGTKFDFLFGPGLSAMFFVPVVPFVPFV